nr:zinc finger, CCHC-type [Tanacetum cinerariifolium]
MLRLQGLGSNTPMGVPYTDDEIMAIVRGGKQRGHIPGVGRVLPGQHTVIPPPSQGTHLADMWARRCRPGKSPGKDHACNIKNPVLLNVTTHQHLHLLPPVTTTHHPHHHRNPPPPSTTTSLNEPITDLDSPITPPAYTYNPNSEEEEEATISSLMNSKNRFDDTQVRGFKDLKEIYQIAREVETETLLFTEEEPRNYKEASTDKKWIEAMEIELDSINKNNTWTLTTLPTNQKAIGLKWVFKTKRDAKGKIIKYKARLVAKGYEEVYVTQPGGFIQQENSEKVYKLTKALYGLRQAPRAWNMKLDQTLKSLDFKKCNLEQAVYTKRSKTSTLIVGVYVDDLIITDTPRKELEEERLPSSKQVTSNKILKETSMMDSNDTKIPMDPGTKLVKAEDGNSVDATYYRILIGSLRYLLHTRPDLSYSVGLLSRFMQDPKDHHLKTVKQVIRYIKGTKEHGIIYKKEGGCRIIEFMAATEAACQALWLKRLLSELTGWEEERIKLKVDNISAIALVRNQFFMEEVSTSTFAIISFVNA